MLKNQILNQIGNYLDEWLLGFDKSKDFSVNMFKSEKVNLKNAIINSDKVNDLLYEYDVPL